MGQAAARRRAPHLLLRDAPLEAACANRRGGGVRVRKRRRDMGESACGKTRSDTVGAGGGWPFGVLVAGACIGGVGTTIKVAGRAAKWRRREVLRAVRQPMLTR